MQVGHGPIQTLCTARAQRAKRPLTVISYCVLMVTVFPCGPWMVTAISQQLKYLHRARTVPGTPSQNVIATTPSGGHGSESRRNNTFVGSDKGVVPAKEAACRSTKHSTHARPGMHMQQCSAVPLWHMWHMARSNGC